MDAQSEIGEVAKRHSEELRKIPGVSGVGSGRGKNGGLVITVYLNRDDATVTKSLPKEIEGYPVEFVYSGAFRKL
jgi:hypothetical protein